MKDPVTSFLALWPSGFRRRIANPVTLVRSQLVPQKLVMKELEWERDEMVTMNHLREVLEQVELYNPILESDGYGEFPDKYTLSKSNIDHILNLLRQEE